MSSAQAWDVSKLCFEADTEPYAKQRDAAVRTLAAEAGITVFSPTSHTIYVRLSAPDAWCRDVSCHICVAFVVPPSQRHTMPI